MHRRILVASLAALVLVGASVIAASAISSKAPITQPVTLVFQSKNTASDYIDLGTAGQSLGDELVSVNVLQSGGQIAGRLNAACTLMTKQALCHAIVRIHGGEVVLDGQIPSSFFQGGSITKAPKLAITGGTASYQHAHGYATVSPPAGGAGPDFTLYLTP